MTVMRNISIIIFTVANTFAAVELLLKVYYKIKNCLWSPIATHVRPYGQKDWREGNNFSYLDFKLT